MYKATPQQQRILDYIYECVRTQGYPPTYDEIKETLRTFDDFHAGCGNQPVNLLRRQISRQVGEPPVGIAGNDIGETRSAAAVDSKVAQERT